MPRALRICAFAILGFVGFDLVDGVFLVEPESRTDGEHSVQAPSAESHDAEFCCARATVVAPVFIARVEAAPVALDVPPPVQPAYGFPPLPFHPPKTSL